VGHRYVFGRTHLILTPLSLIQHANSLTQWYEEYNNHLELIYDVNISMRRPSNVICGGVYKDADDYLQGRFDFAPKAMEIATRMVEILGLDAEDLKTIPRSLKGWWSCNNCPSWMIGMVSEDLVSGS